MTEHEYLTIRFKELAGWYERSTARNRIAHFVVQSIALIGASAIPVLSRDVIGSWKFVSVIVAILGAIVTVATGFSTLGRFQELWINHRKTAEALYRERALFETNVAPYDGENTFPKFVQRIESIVADENASWARSAVIPAKPS